MKNKQFNAHEKRKIYNFSAGPSLLPDSVLEQIESELWNWKNTNSSVMEMSHRSKYFYDTLDETEALLRRIMLIPNNYRVLFLPGGARGQFAAIPLNLATDNQEVDYINSGLWSQLAIKEASRYATINIAADGNKYDYNKLDEQSNWNLNPNAAYVHITSNETIKGVQYPFIPQTGNVPLIADMTSNILATDIDISKFGMLYAGAQKNLGIAGVTIVIIRDDLLTTANRYCPSILNYKIQANSNSMCNTPPVFPIYVSNLVLKWIENNGGVAKIATINRNKSSLIYDCIDNSDFYSNEVDIAWRSDVNIFFRLNRQELENKFLQEATENNLYYLKGHSSSNGIRASMYNAAPLDYAQKLADFMYYFAKKHS